MTKVTVTKEEGSKIGVVAEKAVFLSIHFERFGNNRKVATSNIEIDADKDFISVSKHLVESEELHRITSLDSEILAWIYSVCLPFDKGIHILPLGLVENVDAKLRAYRDRRAALVTAFVARYPELCREAAIQLRGLYDSRDYPSAKQVEQEFGIVWQYIGFTTPGKLKEINPEMFAEERAKVARRMEQAYEEIRQVLRATMLDLVGHLRDRLTLEPGGKVKRLATTTVTNLQEFLETFRFRNITDDTELEVLAGRVSKMLSGVDAEVLRRTDNLRDEVRQTMDTVASRLEVLTGGRKFRLDEAD